MMMTSTDGDGEGDGDGDEAFSVCRKLFCFIYVMCIV